jgi:hypothetical protein
MFNSESPASDRFYVSSLYSLNINPEAVMGKKSSFLFENKMLTSKEDPLIHAKP